MRVTSERTGWILSATLHVGIAVAAVVGLPHLGSEPDLAPPPISIEFVQIAEQNRVVAPEPEPAEEKQEETVVEEKPVLSRNEPAPALAAEVVPLPEAKPVKKVEPKPTPKPEPKPEVSERMEIRSQVVPQSKPKAPSRLNTKRLTALLDKAAKEQDDTNKVADEKKEEKKPTPQAEKPKTDMFAGIRGRVATATLMQALQQKVMRCWNIPAGAEGIQDMQVKVSVTLSTDGNIIGRPDFVGAGNLNDPDRAFFRVFAESARRAVQLCAPFPEASDYIRETGDNQIIFNFSPSMLGG
jgi:outer membrane biosynthesis protein TonB